MSFSTLCGRLGWVVLLGALAATQVYSARRFGRVPRQEHLRDPNGIAYGAFWNFLSTRKWTEAGVALHRRYLVFQLKVIALVLGLLVGLSWLCAYTGHR